MFRLSDPKFWMSEPLIFPRKRENKRSQTSFFFFSPSVCLKKFSIFFHFNEFILNFWIKKGCGGGMRFMTAQKLTYSWSGFVSFVLIKNTPLEVHLPCKWTQCTPFPSPPALMHRLSEMQSAFLVSPAFHRLIRSGSRIRGRQSEM